MRIITFFLVAFMGPSAFSQSLFDMPANTQSRVSSFENLNGKTGSGGKTNQGAKGNAFEWIQLGETKILLNTTGEGIIQRIWMTIDKDPLKLRSLRLQMFWDYSPKPAVDVPMGDFFVYNLGKGVAFESSLFSTAEGRSFNCYIPMPFRKAAKIQLINEGRSVVKLYYDVDFILQKLAPSAMYFHAAWTRQMTAKLGADFEILPKVTGKGRFLGMSVGLITDSTYEKSWWGEGEVKMFMDDDKEYPTIVGTGAEDYIGSAWGLGAFTNMYQGCTIANDSTREFNFYRWHVPDAIYFSKSMRVTIQQIGGWGNEDVKKLFLKGVNLKPITIDRPEGFVRLLDMPNAPQITDDKFPNGWVNFYRVDDYSAVSYFYLDRPMNNLPALASVEVRTKNVR